MNQTNHNTGITILFDMHVDSLKFPQEVWETGPTVELPYPRRHEGLTIYRY